MKTRVQEIDDKFYMIPLPMPFQAGHVNVFACVDDKHITLIDTGLNLPGTFSVLEESIETIGFSIKDINRILVTHYHFDHCGIAGRIKEISGAYIEMSGICLQTVEASKDEQRVELLKTFCSEHGLEEKTINRITKSFGIIKKIAYPFEADRILSVNKPIKVGSKSLEVIPTPGHSRGHVCFYNPESKLLFSGDHILPDITTNLSMDLLKPDFRPLQSYFNSLEKLMDLSISMVYPAHGKPFSGLINRIEEIYEHHCRRAEAILDSLNADSKTAFQVALDIFGSKLSEFEKHLALHETCVHLIELEVAGKIKREMRGGKYFFQVMRFPGSEFSKHNGI